MGMFAVQYNSLTGVLPSSMCNWAPNYRSALTLSDNNFIGSIPDCFGDFQFVTAMWVNNSQLSGSLPKLLIQSKTLTTFLAQNNKFSGSINDLFDGFDAKYSNLQIFDGKT
jgi:hypothetical protein